MSPSEDRPSRAEAPRAGRRPRLPEGFVFGVGTSAYQVEGAVAEDGRGPSIWDTFSHRPGVIADGSTGDVSCDHYHRYAEDIGMLSRLGVGGYRFSVSWSRVLPTGSGQVNQAGLDFYDRMVDELLSQGIVPMATLTQGDLPQALEDDGGWLNRATADRFAEYAAVVGERLSDRVHQWIPVNSPNVTTVLGYGAGQRAPGRTLSFSALPAAHHMLLAHGRGAVALRAAGATSVGCANNHSPVWPASEAPEDVGASKLMDMFWNGMFLEPLLLGRYPFDLGPLLEGSVHDGDLATIRQPLDFYGINYYSPIRIAAAPEDSDIPFIQMPIVGYPLTDSGWPVVPAGLKEWLIMLRARYRAALPPVIITESGCAYGSDGGPESLHDQDRIDYLNGHLTAIAEAILAGVDVRGYYVWTLMDNFEWAVGLSERFGLVHVDFETQARTPKASFDWYRDLIAEH